LAAVRSVTVTPDGKNLYAAGPSDSAVAVFSRDEITGALSFVEVVRDPPGAVDGLGSAYTVAASPDSNHIYVTGHSSDAVVVLARNATTGELTFVEVHKDGVGGVQALDGPRMLVVSPDGHHVHVTASRDHSLLVFERNPTTGRLTPKEIEVNGVGGVTGLAGAWGATTSHDGNHVYVAGEADDAVAVFDSWGPAAQSDPPQFISKWGSKGSLNGQLDYPIDLAATPDGTLYVAEINNNRIQKFDSSGAHVTKWGSYGSSDGQFDGPHGIGVSPIGHVYVADSFNHRVQVFDADGNHLLSWGSLGSSPGEFDNPWGVAVDSASNVYVIDRDNSRIQKFDTGGNFLKEWGSGQRGADDYISPLGIAVGPQGDVYISESDPLEPPSYRIKRFDGNGALLASWGTGPSGRNGRFNLPKRPAVDPDGNVYVADRLNHRIVKFDKNGRFLCSWGTSGSGDGEFNQPLGVVTDSTGRVFVADTANHRIQVFGGPYLEIIIAEAPLPDQTLWPTAPSFPQVQQ
jgi:DNA-binding beta-propeller fold protein YncE